MFHKRQQRLGFFAAAMASAAIVVATAGSPAVAAEGPNDIQSCQLGPNGENPCPDAGPDQPKTEAELCTLGYGPNGKLQCVDDSGAPDDFKSCEPDKQNPDVNPCNHGGGGEGGGEGGGGEGGGGEGGGENPGDGGEGGGEPENPGGGSNQHKPQIYPPDPHKPGTGDGKESLKLTGGIPVPTRIDTGAGATARPSAWLLLLAPAVFLMAAAIRTAIMAPDLASADQDR